MSNPADNATPMQRFNDAVRGFTAPSATRHAKLMPMKDGIIELRQKGVSLRLIRELLATVDVMVGTDTIARFLAEMNCETPSPRSPKRTERRSTTVRATPRQPTLAAPTTNGASMPMPRAVVESRAERLRTVAHSVFARGDETLCFVAPEHEQVVAAAFVDGLVKATQRVRVEEHLQKRVHVAAFQLHLGEIKTRGADNMRTTAISRRYHNATIAARTFRADFVGPSPL